MGVLNGISKLAQIFKNFARHVPKNAPSDNIEAQLNAGARHIKAIGAGDIVPVWFTHKDAGSSISGSVTLTRRENEHFTAIIKQAENSADDYQEIKYQALQKIIQARPEKQQPPIFKL